MDPDLPKVVGTLILDQTRGLIFRARVGEPPAAKIVDITFDIFGGAAEQILENQLIRPIQLPELLNLFWAFRGKVVQSDPSIEASMGADRHALAVTELVLRDEQRSPPSPQYPRPAPLPASPRFTRVQISAMVGPDFEAVRRQVNQNLPRHEQEAEYREYLVQRSAPRCEGMSENEVRQFFAVYFEELQAMIDRQTRELDFRDSLQRTVVRTAVRATVWDVIFNIFR